mmetsp:Transcript_25620/g.39422  ORF Transcript_25620/g.39422 Transcript_25620/m.39422 type:complete len:91 (+) Transcript_25620:41-313(+)
MGTDTTVTLNDRIHCKLNALVEAEQQAVDPDDEENDMKISTEILCMFFLMLIAISSGHTLKKSGHKYLQEAGLTTLIGIATGYLLLKLDI